MSSQQVTDRFLLRLTILYEYYKIAHETETRPDERLIHIINGLKGSLIEKKMALRYLVDAELLDGRVLQDIDSFQVHVNRVNINGIKFIENIIGEFDFDCIKSNLLDDENIETPEGKFVVFNRILLNTLKDNRYACGLQLLKMVSEYFIGHH